jgi:outer membrane immunogenic protein
MKTIFMLVAATMGSRANPTRQILASCVGILCAGTAVAADLPQSVPAPASPTYVTTAAPYNWSGFYIGANGGYGWANAAGSFSAAGGLLGGLSGSTSGNANGAIAGGQAGFNWQFNSLVLGIEGDGDWSGQTKNLSVGCGAGCAITATSGINWFATVRGRIGFAADRILIYGTGGVAWLNVSDKIGFAADGITVSLLSLSDNPVGFTVGGGVEYGLTDMVSARVEYLFLDANYTASAPIALFGGTVTESGTLKDSMVRAGLNIRLPLR